ncbi:hypothetical protein HK096_006997 [Nowakowskiella sp. JEL0078]|nr:hypothetical protein HK096_006997 [Nowakowskiella sp. JEL0078]
MSNGTGELIQATLEAWPSNGWCGATTGQWCVRASVFGSFGQHDGAAAAIDFDDKITIDYTYKNDGVTWVQTVSSAKLGKVISTLTSTGGPMTKGGLGFATECDADSYTIDNQYYVNTVVKLSSADPAFGATGVKGNGGFQNGKGPYGSATNIHTTDGGLTWYVDLITLPAMIASGPQAPVPSTATTTSAKTTTTTKASTATTSKTTTTTSKATTTTSKATTTTSGSSSCAAQYAQVS